ncbi:conserved hypothetical protein [Anaeromyxobacter dehalogenans 2CP-1]|uniref:DUF2334 domain-containing protein n=1 Tax=Anaeromyxobacter dehalogenans (strain ATCC BAA-258 / DSM 21875 / 2CP-1) TaxID=455488 RepID=B8JA64_ANAD2|nr:conserved hypothetical protein [Anaeromyxobacter dehalogenans 2CP-1]
MPSRVTTRRPTSLVAVACLAWLLAGAARRADAASTMSAAAGAGLATLVLYDDGDPALARASAISAANLASHFGPWRTLAVRDYQPGDASRARAVIYVGTAGAAPPPPALVDEVLQGTPPVLWLDEGLERPGSRARLLDRYGFAPGAPEAQRVDRVRYKGVELSRDADAAGPLHTVTVRGGAARVIASAVTADGAEVPWAVRSGSLTYVAENPLVATAEGDRYLAFCDLLFDLLAPATPERHRALVRIEDVLPTDDPARLRRLADTLAAAGVPFGVAIVPLYVDDRRPDRRRVVRWTDAPAALAALRYMLARGGVPVMHGYTHQRDATPSAFGGVSGLDFEFWTGRVDAAGTVRLEGPVPGDGAERARRRALRGLRELERAEIDRPEIFEYPHYAGSAEASAALARLFPAAYHRGLYFSGRLGGPAADGGGEPVAQLFPFEVTDVYGWRVLPENLGRYAPYGGSGVRARRVEDLVRTARASRVVRDGFASFFFDARDDPRALAEIVRGIQAAGYAFVSPRALVPRPHGR